MNGTRSEWDAKYEWRAVTLLALGFGLVGLDRWIITPLIPTIMRDLHLSYEDVGRAVGALAIAWGVSAIFIGRLADRIGRRGVIVSAMIAFSLMSAFTGFAAGALSLILARACMGAAEGAYAPACTAATSEASEPHRRGRNIGIVFCMFPIFGLGLGPIVATQLLNVTPSWHWVFFIVAIPGLIVAVLLNGVLREPASLAGDAPRIDWSQVLRARNVLLGTLLMISAMCCAFVLGAMLPSYLQDHVGLPATEMGFVMSALGFGGCVGNFALPAVSDHVGRRAAIVASALIAAVALLVLMRIENDVVSLFLAVFVVATFAFGIVGVAAGPVATEAVSVAGASSAIGIISGTAEIFGGGIAPIVAGFVADRFGIEHVLLIGLAGLCTAVPVALALKETAPRFVRSRRPASAQSG